MANPNRFYMSSPRFHIEEERTTNDVSDYRYHKDYSGRHSIADLSLVSYRGRYGSQSERRFHRSRSRSRSGSRSSSSSRTRASRSRSHHSHARSSRRHSSRHGDRHHQQQHRHRRFDSVSSSSSSDSLSSLTLSTPPQFVTPVHEFEKNEKGDLAIKIGDVIEVKRYVDKNWYKGTNLSTRKKGIFPIAYVKEAEVSSTKVVEQLSGRRTACQSTVSEKLLVELPKETERKGSLFYPSDTAIVRDRGNRVTSTGYQEIDQDVILIRPRDTINNEPAKTVQPTVEREVVKEGVTIIQPRRTIEGSVVKDEKIIIPILRKEIPYGEVSKYANNGPEVDIERIKIPSRHRASEERYVVECPKEPKEVKPKEIVVEKPVVVERPREVVIERPREIEEASTATSHGGRSRARSIKEIRLGRDISYSPPSRKKEFKMLPPPQTITYNEYGAPVFVNTKTFAPAPVMATFPRPHYTPRTLEPAPVPVFTQSFPQTRVRRVYEY